MRATWSALQVWPYPSSTPATVPFRSDWDSSLRKLEQEIELLEGDDVMIGVVTDPSNVGLSGQLKNRGAVKHPGVEVSFDAGGRRVAFHTDAYKTLTHNLRAVAMGLEALRAVNRYGITESGEQYAGFAQITAGGPSVDRGRALVTAAGGVRQAQRKHHPDHGGQASDFADVQAYVATLTPAVAR